MQYIGLTVFHERGNGNINDRQVDIAFMGISFRSVRAWCTLFRQISTNVAMVSLTIRRLTLRLWVSRYDRLWHDVLWSGGIK